MTPDTFTIRGETFHVAPWPVRVAAKVIDFLFCNAVIVAAARVITVFFPDLIAGILIVFTFGVAIAWWLLSDAVFKGAGVGKRLLGLRLIHRCHGSKPSAGQAALRQLKYSMFMSLWGLVGHAVDDRNGTAQPDEFITVTTEDAPAHGPPAPPRRELDIKGLGSFIANKYSHGKRPPS
jgi:uncharacterized RDD family membrane protein YckC